MSEPRILRFYLHDSLRKRASSGNHNFINKTEAVLRAAGYRVEYRQNSPEERKKSAGRRGYSIFLMDAPLQDRALNIRRVYHYPFWAIERNAKRWEWPVSLAEFPAQQAQGDEADKFYRFWQGRLFGSRPHQTSQDGFVYVPLQGRLLSHRSFQTCSPLEMLEQTLLHDPKRKIFATLHPNEDYTPAELSKLEQLEKRHGRLNVSTGGMEALLQTCDYVVTQNSGAAFNGYFFGKPAVLFSQIDFHHIAANVTDLGVKKAIQQGPGLRPDYAAYIYWFWQVMAINAGHEHADQKIRSALSRSGLPM